MPQAMKIPDAEGTVEKNWETLQKWPAWQLTNIKSRCVGHSGSRKEQRTVHFSMLMDICHLKNADLEPKCQKYEKAELCSMGHCNRRLWSLRCIYRAKKEGQTATQVTAAKVIDVVAKLPRCAGQAAGAVSAYTKVKIVKPPALFKLVM